MAAAAAAAESQSKKNVRDESDNPWEVAAVNDSFHKSAWHASVDSTGRDADEPPPPCPKRRSVPEPRPAAAAAEWTREYDARAAAARAEQWAQTLRRAGVRLGQCLDGMVALGGTVYAGILLDATSPPLTRPMAAVAIVILLVTLLSIRCLAAAWDQPCGGCLAVHVSAILAMFYLVASLVAGITLHWIHPLLLEIYLRQHDNLLLPLEISNFLLHQSSKLWIGLLILFVAECARWQLLQTYRHSLFFDHDEDTNNSTYYDDDNGLLRIRGDAPLRESLLRHGGRRTRRDQPNNGRTQWWQWDPWTTRRQRDDSPDPRDNEDTILFAAVQEEWASRTEEDPFWWSRDEEEIARELTTTPPSPPTWAEDQPPQQQQ